MISCITIILNCHRILALPLTTILSGIRHCSRSNAIPLDIILVRIKKILLVVIIYEPNILPLIFTRWISSITIELK